MKEQTILTTKKISARKNVSLLRPAPPKPMAYVSTMTPERRLRERRQFILIQNTKLLNKLCRIQAMSTNSKRVVLSKTFLKKEFDDELELFINKTSNLIDINDDYTLTLSDGQNLICNLDISDIYNTRKVLTEKFYLSGVSDFSESCDITLTLYYNKNANIMESINPRSVDKTSKRVSILSSVIEELMSYQDKLNNNKETQLFIESLLWDNYQMLDNESYINGINLNLLDNNLKNYLLENQDNLLNGCNKLIEYYNRNKIPKKEKYYSLLLKDLSPDYLLNICLLYFVKIATFADSDNKNQTYLIKVTKDIGTKLISFFLYNLKKSENNKDKYSTWYNNFMLHNKELGETLASDTFVVSLGANVISVLEKCDMVEKELIKISIDNDQYILSLKDKRLINRKEKVIINFPNKLPMIVKPLPFSETEKGGYLLNDVKYSEDVIIDKNCYALKTQIGESSGFYKMINNISSVSFKVNIELLEYIKLNNHKHGFLINTNIPHKYENLSKRTGIQESEYSAHKSKIVLEQTILDIVEFYKNYPNIYFPVRSDQRGRLYCMPHYFNYQGNELSKALILFSEPGFIHKSDLSAINYLKLYGANCYGLSKKSNKEKIQWVNENENHIVNYDKSSLINESKDKLLFLSFCMEYKRLITFLDDENTESFSTYLPIQLDATCNGFQHLALLSNEKILFKELNLHVDNDEQYPKDFYNFLIYKLIMLLESKIKYPDTKDKSEIDSYKRLLSFGWERNQVKKAIMTITYNASDIAMVDYIKSNLYRIDKKDSSDTIWYASSEENQNNLVSNKDLFTLVSFIKQIVTKDFEKIKKLTRYLKNIATLLNLLELPIVWNLPSGLIIRQSYMETKSTSISPFMYDKSKINIKVTIKDKFNKKKQLRALMPNLIHSLDGASLCLLAIKFFNNYTDLPQFYSVHDCFGTTMDKIETLKILLASVYTDIYSESIYLEKLDKSILDYIENNTPGILDRESRTVDLSNTSLRTNQYKLLNADWVKHDKHLYKDDIREINSQYLLI